MRKVKLALKEDTEGKKLWLFPTVEAIYLWACAVDRGAPLEVPGIEELLLEQGGFIEAELRGFEYVYDGPKSRRFDYVRLGKAQRVENASGLLVTIHAGWVCGSMLPMKSGSTVDLEVTTFADGDNGKIDLPALFKDDTTTHDDE